MKSMAGKIPNSWRHLAGATGGNEVAEAALVLPIVFMVLLGIFWFGQAFRIYGTLTQAARVAARAAANPACTTCAAGNAAQNSANAVQTTFAAAHLDTTKLTPPTTPPALLSCNPAFTGGCEKLANPNVNICVQEGVQLSSTTAGPTAAGVCGVSVSFQYPYQFWFPGTSLNKQILQLSGSAQMRSETN